MKPDDLVKGGQGRTPQDVRDTTAGCLWVIAAAVVLGITAILLRSWGG